MALPSDGFCGAQVAAPARRSHCQRCANTGAIAHDAPAFAENGLWRLQSLGNAMRGRDVQAVRPFTAQGNRPRTNCMTSIVPCPVASPMTIGITGLLVHSGGPRGQGVR